MTSRREQLIGTRVLAAGGADYIGSHTLLLLSEAGANVHVLDNFANSSREILDRIRSIASRSFSFDDVDIRDLSRLIAALNEFRPQVVVHFVGLKAVGEYVSNPLSYYDNNVAGSLNLLSAMNSADCGCIIFSSSATVYGEAKYLPLDEDHPVSPANPYGRTKAIVEGMIQDWVASDPGRSGISLRYFNPIGAHRTGKIGENPKGILNNLVPFVARVASGALPEVQVFGSDFETRDGTGERDYIHVEDLAAGHLAALTHVLARPGYEVVNLGTRRGSTVLEVLDAYEKACGKPIPRRLAPRRPGDTASSVANPTKAEQLLGWRAERSLLDACRSSWQWQEDYSAIDFSSYG